MKFKNLYYLDSVYSSALIYQTINILMDKGSKNLSEKTIYNAFFFLSLKYRECPYLIFFETIERIRPTLYIKFRRKWIRRKKKITIIPITLNYYQQYRRSLKWIKLIYFLRFNDEILVFKFFNECINLHVKNESLLLDKKLEFYQCAIKNKLNKHYRW